MHDLIRLYAAERAREEPTDDSDEALSRLVDFHLRTAHTAAGRRTRIGTRSTLPLPGKVSCHRN
ncbi:hypothetical protein GCM10023238_08270 [Streptomyces heliomycini]